MFYDENLLNEEQQKIERCYYLIGERYAAAHKDDEQSEYADLLAEIKASEKRIADHRAEVMKANGLMLCPNCGEQIMDRSAFCNFCGTKIEKPAPEESVVEEPVAEEPVVKEPEIEAPAAEETESEKPAVEETGSEKPGELPGTNPDAVIPPVPVDETEAEQPALSDGVCPSCGAALEPDCAFCVECGARLADFAAAQEAPAEEAPVRFCTECGNMVEDDSAMFCNNCGARLGGGDIYSHSTEPTVKRCPNCGFNTTDDDVAFCIECGTKLI